MQRLFRNILRPPKRRRAFNSFLLDVTTSCELRCIICPRVAFMSELKGRQDMPLETFEKIARYFPRVQFVYFTGWEGEPLLHKDIFKMIKRAKESCLVGLVTNGMPLTEEISKRLIDAGLDYLTVSMAGASKQTHEGIRTGSDFDQICENLKVLKELKEASKTEKPEVNLSFLMTKENISELPFFIEVAKELGAERVTAPNLSYVATTAHDEIKAFSWNKANQAFLGKIKEAERKAEEYGVTFKAYPLVMEEVLVCEENPLTNIYISCDGFVSPCVYLNFPMGSIPRIFRGKEYMVKRTCFGDITREDLVDIWNGKEYREFRQRFSKRAEPLFGFSLGPSSLMKRKEAPIPEVCKTCYKAYGI